MEITVIKQRFDVAIIEWVDIDGMRMKGISPVSIINGNTIDDERMSLVIPDCIDWVFALEGTIRSVSIVDIARELYKKGLWKLSDIRSNPRAIEAAIKSAIGCEVSAILRAAESFESGGSHG